MILGREATKGFIEPLIMGILHEGDTYGYFLAKKIAERSRQNFQLKDGTLYPALRRLEQDGLVQGYWGDQEGGGRRKYYRLTETGRVAYLAWRGNWGEFVRSVNAVLGVSL